MTADMSATTAADLGDAHDLYAAMMRRADVYTAAIVAGESPPVVDSLD